MAIHEEQREASFQRWMKAESKIPANPIPDPDVKASAPPFNLRQEPAWTKLKSQSINSRVMGSRFPTLSSAYSRSRVQGMVVRPSGRGRHSLEC